MSITAIIAFPMTLPIVSSARSGCLPIGCTSAIPTITPEAMAADAAWHAIAAATAAADATH